jgi:hypothetical protein
MTKERMVELDRGSRYAFGVGDSSLISLFSE